jgi:hypothetical protein
VNSGLFPEEILLPNVQTTLSAIESEIDLVDNSYFARRLYAYIYGLRAITNYYSQNSRYIRLCRLLEVLDKKMTDRGWSRGEVFSSTGDFDDPG